MRRLIIGFYLATTWQDWQFGPGIYAGDHLELSLYVGPWSFNLEFELEKESITIGISSDVHIDDFLGRAEMHPRARDMRLKYDPFTHKPYKVYRSPSKGAKW